MTTKTISSSKFQISKFQKNGCPTCHHPSCVEAQTHKTIYSQPFEDLRLSGYCNKGNNNCRDTMTILIMTLLITTLLILKILIILNMDDKLTLHINEFTFIN